MGTESTPRSRVRAIGTSAETQAKRDALYSYVTERLMSGGDGRSDPAELARLVCDAPAKLTLTDNEWWNVALLLAQEITYAR